MLDRGRCWNGPDDRPRPRPVEHRILHLCCFYLGSCAGAQVPRCRATLALLRPQAAFQYSSWPGRARSLHWRPLSGGRSRPFIWPSAASPGPARARPPREGSRAALRRRVRGRPTPGTRGSKAGSRAAGQRKRAATDSPRGCRQRRSCRRGRGGRPSVGHSRLARVCCRGRVGVRARRQRARRFPSRRLWLRAG